MTISIVSRTFEGPHTHTMYLRNAAGIYVVLDQRSNGNWTIIDVGESEDIRSRIENHDREGCWKRHSWGTLGIAAYYTPGWTANHRRSLESEIRDSYAPACGIR